MSFTFPYQFGFIDNRKVPYPIVPVELFTIRGKRRYAFIIDTGADDLTLPHYMITLMGLDTKKLKESQAQGVGAELVKTWEARIKVTFCSQIITLPCSFTDNDQTPYLLGKEGIFDRFNVIFDNDKQMTIFEDRKKS